MLILTRRIGEQIMIGDDIVVTVISDRQGQIGLGIDAPRDVSIHRAEIFERIQAEQQQKKAANDG